jgi:hypothetical protein
LYFIVLLCFVIFLIFARFLLQNISDEKFVRLFDALNARLEAWLEVLSLANTDMPDRVVSKLCDALE